MFPCSHFGRRRPLLLIAQTLLLVTAASLLGAFAWSQAARAYHQWRLSEILRSEASAVPPGPDTLFPAPAGVLRQGPLGLIEIPRLGTSAVIVDGVDSYALSIGVGHIPGTAYPGEMGNIGLAAHRDSFFRRLGHVQPMDRIRLITPRGHTDYFVDFTRVVNPSHVSLLRPSPHPVLTLVTCYPFQFIGAAPQRFVVQALPSPALARLQTSPSASLRTKSTSPSRKSYSLNRPGSSHRIFSNTRFTGSPENSRTQKKIR
jgi:sortase A